MDNFTKFLRKVFENLFRSHNLRTSLGVILGVSLSSAFQLWSPLLDQFNNYFDFHKLNDMQFIVFGILIMHVKTIYFLINRKATQDEELDKLIQMIEDAKKLGMPEWQIRQMYVATYMKILEKFELTDEMKAKLADIEKRIPQTDT